jgi:hypothetical protein
MRPLPFKVRFTPRTNEHRETIIREAGRARGFLAQFESESKVEMEQLEAI